MKKSSNTEERLKAKKELLQLKILTDTDWSYFKDKFEVIHPDFFKLLKSLDFKFTKSEERFLILKKLNLETKDMAQIIGISNDSVLKTQYRLRKKVGVDKTVDILKFLSL